MAREPGKIRAPLPIAEILPSPEGNKRALLFLEAKFPAVTGGRQDIYIY